MPPRQSNRNFQQRDRSNDRFMVLIGPVPDNSQEFKTFLKEKLPEISEIESSNWKSDMEQLSDLPIFYLELSDYNSLKNIANVSGQLSFNDKPILISIADANNLEKFSSAFIEFLPKLIRNDHIDLSKIFFKFGKEIGFNCNVPFHLSSLLFFASIISEKKGSKITSINLSSNRIRNINGMRNISTYFPDLELVTIGDNQVEPEALQEYLPNARATDDVPIEPEWQDDDNSEESSDSGSDYFSLDKTKAPASPPPRYNFIVHKEKEIYCKYTLDMFPNNIDMIEEERVFAFLNPLFDCLQNKPHLCSSFYSDYAELSFLISQRGLEDETYTQLSPLRLYIDNSTNLMQGKFKYWKGEEITDGLSFIFPYGFKANISDISSQQIDENLFVIDMHGGVLGKEGYTFPFDRTLVLRKEKSILLVTNDCICFRN